MNTHRQLELSFIKDIREDIEERERLLSKLDKSNYLYPIMSERLEKKKSEYRLIDIYSRGGRR
jgi:hypothetical protein